MLLEPDQQPVRRDGLPGQPQARAACWASRPTRTSRAVPEQVDLAVIVTPARDRARTSLRECVERRRARGRSSSRPASRRSGRRAWSWSGRCWQMRRRGEDAHDRAELPGRDEPADGPERDLRRAAWRGPGNVGLHQPERRALHGHARLEPAGESSASARSSRSARCSTSAGAT